MTYDLRSFILLGAGGHATVLLSLAEMLNLHIVGVCDPLLAKHDVGQWNGIRVLGSDEALDRVDAAVVSLILGVGQQVRSDTRRRLYEKCRRRGFSFPPLVHPAAWVAPTAKLSSGVQVMAGAIVQPNSRIGENTIINTRSSVDHDCQLGDHVHIAPGATLCGEVQIDDGAFIAAGATVIQGVRVGIDAIVGAGTTLRRSLPAGMCVVNSRTRPVNEGK